MIKVSETRSALRRMALTKIAAQVDTERSAARLAKLSATIRAAWKAPYGPGGQYSLEKEWSPGSTLANFREASIPGYATGRSGIQFDVMKPDGTVDTLGGHSTYWDPVQGKITML